MPSGNTFCIFSALFVVRRKQSSSAAHRPYLLLRATCSGGRGEKSSSWSKQESTGAQARQRCGEVLPWEKTLYSFALQHHLLLCHSMVEFALKKYLNMGLNIKRVIFALQRYLTGSLRMCSQAGCQIHKIITIIIRSSSFSCVILNPGLSFMLPSDWWQAKLFSKAFSRWLLLYLSISAKPCYY